MNVHMPGVQIVFRFQSGIRFSDLGFSFLSNIDDFNASPILWRKPETFGDFNVHL